MDELEYALKQGWLEPKEDGNYRIVPDENNPVWQWHKEETEKTLWEMYEKGLLYPSIREDDGEVVWQLTEKGKSYNA